MTDIMLGCPTCPDPFPAPVDSNGVVQINPSTLSQVETSTGRRFMTLCPQCADKVFGGQTQISAV